MRADMLEMPGAGVGVGSKTQAAGGGALLDQMLVGSDDASIAGTAVSGLGIAGDRRVALMAEAGGAHAAPPALDSGRKVATRWSAASRTDGRST